MFVTVIALKYALMVSVRGVDGSCAKHLAVESYTIIYAANSHTYYYLFSITHSLFHSRLKTFFSANPSHRSLSFLL